jgi:hypothetical protein
VFRPLDMISRAELNAIVIRMILNNYLDESSSVWYSEYARLSSILGIMRQERYSDNITRNDTALILVRTYRDQLYDNYTN